MHRPDVRRGRLHPAVDRTEGQPPAAVRAVSVSAPGVERAPECVSDDRLVVDQEQGRHSDVSLALGGLEAGNSPVRFGRPRRAVGR